MKIKTILSILLAGTLLASCHGDLNIIQKSEVSANSMWQDEGDATSAMYGMFNKFRATFSTGYIYWGEYRTGLWADGLAGQTARDQVYQNQIPTNHSYANWADLYTTINNANLILKYTPDIAFNSEDAKNKILANAYYVRAFCYYWNGRIWGDAPILLDGFESDQQEGLFPVRQPAEDVFTQVGEDINNALTLMPASVSDRNLASSGAINMLKADYYLWMYKVRNAGEVALDNANTAVQAVLNNSNYSLEENFNNIFYNELGNEIIFAWSYIQDEYTGGYPGDYLVPSQYVSDEAIENPVKVGSHQQWCFYTEDYKTLLSENKEDQRTIVSFETYFDEPKNATFQWINKFAGTWTNGTRIFDSDIIVYRYADVLTLLAEAIVREGNTVTPEAVELLNMVHTRAGLPAYTMADFAGADAFLEAVLTERGHELWFEGVRRSDLIRYGRYIEYARKYKQSPTAQDYMTLMPLPQSVIDESKGKIIQNPGY